MRLRPEGLPPSICHPLLLPIWGLPSWQTWPNSRAHQLLPAWHPCLCLAGGDPGVCVGWGGGIWLPAGFAYTLTPRGLAGWAGGMAAHHDPFPHTHSVLSASLFSCSIYVRLSFISLSLAMYWHLPASPCVFVLSALSLCLYAPNFLFLDVLTSASLSSQDFL